MGRLFPPRLADRLLTWYCDPRLLEELQGDLAEQFADRLDRMPSWRARLAYWLDVLFLLRRFARRTSSENATARGPIMLKSYLTTALRNVRRHPTYAIINLIGMAVGLTCVLLVATYVHHELSYDRFHENAERIHRVAQQQPGNVFMGSDRFAVGPAGMGQMLRERAADVEAATTFSNARGLMSGGDAAAFEASGLWADSSFFDVFSFDLLRGDAATALHRPATIVLTRSLARKLFGYDDPLGQTVTFDSYYDDKLYTVTGVTADVPAASHVQFDYVASIYSHGGFLDGQEEWSNSSFHTFFALREGGSAAGVQTLIQRFIEGQRADEFADRPDRMPQFYTEPLTDVHLHTDAIFDLSPKGNLQYLYLYSAIALVILLLACANYTNLATARALRRTREVGVRKAMGARRGQLVAQFLGEAFALTGIAFLIGLLLAQLVLPAFGTLLGRDLSLQALKTPPLVFGLLAVLIVTGVGAGLYPALVAGQARPALVLKGRAVLSVGGRRLRDALVVGQYAAAIALMVATVVMWQQMHYVRTTEVGFNREQVIGVPLRGVDASEREAFKAALSELAGVDGVTASSQLPINVGASSTVQGWEGSREDDLLTIYQLNTDLAFFDVYQIPLVEGAVPAAMPAEDAPPVFLLNETAVRQLGWQTAIGKTLPRGGGGPVVGVVQDFHLHSMHLPIAPLMIQFEPSWANWVSLRIRTADVPGLLGQIEGVWATFSSYPFDYRFLDDAFDALYERELKLGQGFQYFTLLALLIASLGLFGIAALMAAQRTKEVGVRKVLGASVPGLVGLLSSDFLKLVALAFVLAVPLAYFAMQAWLDDFAYRVGLGAWTFVAVGAVVLLLAFLTVSVQTWRVARANPVEALRYE